jgi:hypothetical protein
MMAAQAGCLSAIGQPQAVARGGTYSRAVSYGHCDGMQDGNRIVDNGFAPDLWSTIVGVWDRLQVVEV